MVNRIVLDGENDDENLNNFQNFGVLSTYNQEKVYQNENYK